MLPTVHVKDTISEFVGVFKLPKILGMALLISVGPPGNGHGAKRLEEAFLISSPECHDCQMIQYATGHFTVKMSGRLSLNFPSGQSQ